MAEIITSDKEILGQVIELSQLSDNDSEFCMNFLSASSRMGNSIVPNSWVQIDRALFSLEPNRAGSGFDFPSSSRTRQNTKYQTYLAFAQVILGNKVLPPNQVRLTKPNGELAEEWAETAKF